MWRRALLAGGVAAVAHRLVTAVVMAAAARGGGLAPFTRWDGGWYLNIAAHGYAATDVMQSGGQRAQSALVFPPAYPALVRAAAAVVTRYDLAALLVSGVALLLGCAGLHRLVELRLDRRVALASVLCTLAWPASFFLGVAYADALVFAAVVWAFLFAAQRRWLLAGVCVAVAGMGKTVAFVALAGLLVELWTARGGTRGLASLVVPPAAALGGWMAYQWAAFGDPLRFLAAEKGWGRTLSPPWTAIRQGVDAVNAQHTVTGKLPYLLDLAAVALLLLAVLYGWRRMPRSWTVYAAALLLALTVSGRLESIGRYVLIAFPLFVAMAMALDVKEREWVRPLALVVSVVIGVLLMQRFAVNLWAG